MKDLLKNLANNMPWHAKLISKVEEASPRFDRSDRLYLDKVFHIESPEDPFLFSVPEDMIPLDRVLKLCLEKLGEKNKSLELRIEQQRLPTFAAGRDHTAVKILHMIYRSHATSGHLKELYDVELKGDSVLQLQDCEDQWLDIGCRLPADMSTPSKMGMLLEKLGDIERVERAVRKFSDLQMNERAYEFLWTLFEKSEKMLEEKDNYRTVKAQVAKKGRTIITPAVTESQPVQLKRAKKWQQHDEPPPNPNAAAVQDPRGEGKGKKKSNLQCFNFNEK
jgi:hypothetical protein